jgi:hypothetical protein
MGNSLRGVVMLTAEICRDRAAECQQMAEHAPNARMRDILLDMGRTWTRLALEAEQWTAMNRPSVRITKVAPKNAIPTEPLPPILLQPRGSRRETR